MNWKEYIAGYLNFEDILQYVRTAMRFVVLISSPTCGDIYLQKMVRDTDLS